MEKNNYRQLLLIVIIFVFFSACEENNYIVESYDSNVIQQKLQKMLDEAYDSYLSQCPAYPGGFAFQVLSQKGDYFIHKGLGENVTNQIHFRAASNTKTFTSAGIMLLYQQSKLNISDKITDLIPGTIDPYIPDNDNYNIPYKDDITIWQLLTHRAGVFDITNDAIPADITVDVPYKGEVYLDYVMASNPNHTFGFDELLGVVSICGLSYFPPGTGYHYSNQGYSLLGKIIERVSGITYKQFMMDNFVTPLGLLNTTFPDTGDDQDMPDSFAAGYVEIGDQILDLTKSNMSGNIAEGNLLTTPEDLSKFVRALLKGEAGINLSIINNVMMNCQPSSEMDAGGYGAGLIRWNNLGYGHNGAHVGYLSFMISDPAMDYTVVIFTNCWNLTEDIASFGLQLRLLQDYCRQIKSIILYE